VNLLNSKDDDYNKKLIRRSKLNILSISIKNVLGIEEKLITPDGNIIEITGGNGKGKTSIIESIKDAFGGGKENTLLRNGTDKGVCEIQLDDLLIRKVHTALASKLTVKGKVFGTDSMAALPSPAKVIRELVTPNSIDPVRLLTSSDKDLITAVMDALPMTADPARISSIVGGSVDIEEGQHALAVIGKFMKMISEERTLVNRDNKTAITMRDQLQATLPAEIPSIDEQRGEIEKKQTAIENIRSSARRVSRRVNVKNAVNIDKAWDDSLEAQEVMKEATAAFEKAKALHISLVESNKEEAENAFNDELNRADDLHEEINEISEAISQTGKLQETKKQVDGYAEQVRVSGKKSQKYTQQLKGFEDYKIELCSDLPIKGLELVDGKLLMNGISFRTLNSAARIDLVIELAKVSAGKLGLILLDNSEMMDNETYKEFIAKAKKTDLTFIIARVDQGASELNIL
jgi:DNA repair exonuclease SbcCD ATPase subunit